MGRWGGNLPICNNKVYLVTRGAVYEHIQNDFNVADINPGFKAGNKKMRNMRLGF